MSDNLRRAGGIEVNGIPSADEIIGLGRCNICVSAALALWRSGDMTFDEALRLAVWHLADANARLIQQATDLAARALPEKIILEHPSKP